MSENVNEQPTREQIRKFWEWCGFKWHDVPKVPGTSYWTKPNGKFHGFEPPRIDLNNLFKYAVPKLTYFQLESDSSNGTIEAIACYGKKEEHSNNVNPALALFWVIWEVINNEQ